jgi:hypothetical protein
VLEKALETYTPDLGGALWLGLLVAFLIFGDFRRLVSLRNLALLGLLALAPLLNDIGRWSVELHPTVAPLWWTAIFLITAGHTIWGVLLARREGRPAWTPNVPASGLRLLVGLLVVMNAMQTLGRKPEDAGLFVSLGAQRWLETGTVPYADQQLIGAQSPAFGAASTYGPVLYLSHFPSQLLSGGRQNPPDAVVMDKDYHKPSNVGTRIITLLFHLGGLIGLFLTVRRLAGEQAALGAVALYAAMPFLAGFDAGHGSIAGVRFIFHIAPAALMLLALAAAERPFLSGALFASAAGALFYPVFMFPAWVAWFAHRKARPLLFVAGVATVGAVLLIVIVACSPGYSPLGAVKQFLAAVIEHQEGVGPRQYGTSTFGFWGTHPGLASFWHHPLFGASPFLHPIFLIFLALCAASCWWVRRGGLTSLAAATVVLGAGVQLWKTHGGGTYIEWYLPFLILALVAGSETFRLAGRQTSS